MSARWSAAVLISFLAAGASPVQAEPTASGGAPAPPSASPSATTAPAAAVPSEATAPAHARRDPAGVRGISPFHEAVTRGDHAYVARDFEIALREFKGAITLEPSNPLGHLRAAEVLIQLRDAAGAEDALSAASRYGQDDPAVRGRVLFLTAVGRELQRDWVRAADSWASYEKLQTTPPGGSTPAAAAAPAPAAPSTSAPAAGASVSPLLASALARKQVIEGRQKLEVDMERVRQRIAAEVAAADKAREASAAKK